MTGQTNPKRLPADRRVHGWGPGESLVRGKPAREAGDRALAQIREAFVVARERPTKTNIKTLEAAINNATPNMEFAAQSLSEHAENVVQKSQADLEAMVLAKAQQLGLEAGDLTAQLQIESREAHDE